MDITQITQSKSKPNNRLSKYISIGLFITTCIIVNLQFFSKLYFPNHDTLAVFQFFSYYYSQVLTTNEFPLWLPYTAYGIPTESYLLFSFGPFQYLAILVGYLFNIQNTLNLFTISVIGDYITLGFGAYLFCNLILKNRIASNICIIAILLLSQYDQQIYWNFKILIPIPIALYFAQKWLESACPTYILALAATLLCFAFGSLIYVIPLQFYIICCYCFFLIIINSKPKKIDFKKIIKFFYENINYLKNKKILILSLLLLIIIGVFLFNIAHIYQVMQNEMTYNISSGRSAGNFLVGPDNYLHHGGYGDINKIIEMVNGIPYVEHNFLPFTGLICTIFCIYGFFSKEKSPEQIALLITILFILSFSVIKSQVAHVMYYFPMMSIFRHVGYVVTIAKILLIILAGFGIRGYLHKK
jgi:hypothetical protein